MKRPVMVAFAALTLGLCSIGNRAAAQTWPDKGYEMPDLQMRHLVPDFMSTSDIDFVQHAAACNNAQIEMARMALDRASMQSTRDLAQRILTDQEALHNDLRKLSNNWNVMTPLGAGQRYDRWVKRLEDKSGGDFDQAYIKQARQVNFDSLWAYHQRQGYTQVDDLRDFVLKYLPTLKDDKNVIATAYGK